VPGEYAQTMQGHMDLLEKSRTQAAFGQAAELVLFEWRRPKPTWAAEQERAVLKIAATMEEQYFTGRFSTWWAGACGAPGATPNNNAVEAWNRVAKHIDWVRLRAGEGLVLNTALGQFLAAQGRKNVGRMSPAVLDAAGKLVPSSREILLAAELVSRGRIVAVSDGARLLDLPVGFPLRVSRGFSVVSTGFQQGFGPGESSGSCPPAYLRGAGKVAEIRGHQHHDIFPRDESRVFPTSA
jgi:hypothetical protein